MVSVTVEEAQARLLQLLDGLAPGEGLVITRNARPVAQLVGLSTEQPRPIPGRGRGKLAIVSEDDDHLRDFEDYMP
jgi:antitoxin (DNA-binding transcriptional repressor) of toxin-antitoxin stability system